MATYIFIGDESLLHLSGRDVPLSYFGQTVELTDEQAQMACRVPLLTAAELKSVGITDREMSDALSKGVTSPAFALKKQKALDLFVSKLVALAAPAVVAPSEPNPEVETPPTQIATDPEATPAPDQKEA